MYVVRSDKDNEIVGMCSLLSDAKIMASKDFDGSTFTIEEMSDVHAETHKHEQTK